MKLDDSFFSHFPNIKGIIGVPVGYDFLDLDYLHKKGIIIGRGYGNQDCVADHTMAMMLGLSRMLIEGDKECRTCDGCGYDWNKYTFNSIQVHHKTVGFVGFGAIGQTIAKRCMGFDMNVLYWCRHRRPIEEESKFNAQYCEKLDDIMKESDFIILISIIIINISSIK